MLQPEQKFEIISYFADPEKWENHFDMERTLDPRRKQKSVWHHPHPEVSEKVAGPDFENGPLWVSEKVHMIPFRHREWKTGFPHLYQLMNSAKLILALDFGLEKNLTSLSWKQINADRSDPEKIDQEDTKRSRLNIAWHKEAVTDSLAFDGFHLDETRRFQLHYEPHGFQVATDATGKEYVIEAASLINLAQSELALDLTHETHDPKYFSRSEFTNQVADADQIETPYGRKWHTIILSSDHMADSNLLKNRLNLPDQAFLLFNAGYDRLFLSVEANALKDVMRAKAASERLHQALITRQIPDGHTAENFMSACLRDGADPSYLNAALIENAQCWLSVMRAVEAYEFMPAWRAFEKRATGQEPSLDMFRP